MGRTVIVLGMNTGLYDQRRVCQPPNSEMESDRVRFGQVCGLGELEVSSETGRSLGEMPTEQGLARSRKVCVPEGDGHWGSGWDVGRNSRRGGAVVTAAA